jgi:hypothetical protein
MNFMARQLDGHDRNRLSGRDGDDEKNGAQIPSKGIGSGYFQETHPYRLFEQCSHYCELVSDPRTDPSCPGNRHSDRNLAP